jgi:hypothetical protein
MVATAKKNQNEFQAFYTHCNHITGYMVGLLNCNDGMSVLEPCAGDGAFIDEILSQGCKVQISAFELNNESAINLTKKYLNESRVVIRKADFAFLEENKPFDRVIANPPYGAYQSPEKRAQLKVSYPDIYAKETYGLFLVRAMEMLKPNGRLVFIIPDTFLTLHMHEGLRNKLLAEYTIESLTLFPSNFFPGVNFGYAGLSIISVAKKQAPSNWRFPVYRGLQSPENLSTLLTKKKTEFEAGKLSYEGLKINPSSSFYLSSDAWVQKVLDQNSFTIGDICDVVTGFYSGNDAHYLRRGDHVVRGAKKYSAVDDKLICDIKHENNPPLNGIAGIKHWVPIVKGGNKRFHKPSEWFMDWSKEAIHEYKVINKKKARFQNSQYYFKQGIAVPMVSSSAITGALIDFRLFDQSIVGIFPKTEQQHLLMYLLGFFNSNVCNKLIRTINASANNSSNYIKKIPIIIPAQRKLDSISSMVKSLYEKAKEGEITESDLCDLDSKYFEIFGITDA